MEYIIAVFKSRTQVVKFYEKLRACNISADVVNTPREASLGCGLSVKFDEEAFGYVKNILKAEYFHSFGGFFKVNDRGHHKIVRNCK